MTNLADVVDLIIFDFDGTICESADVKTDAFYQLYLDEETTTWSMRVFPGTTRSDTTKR